MVLAYHSFLSSISTTFIWLLSNCTISCLNRTHLSAMTQVTIIFIWLFLQVETEYPKFLNRLSGCFWPDQLHCGYACWDCRHGFLLHIQLGGGLQNSEVWITRVKSINQVSVRCFCEAAVFWWNISWCKNVFCSVQQRSKGVVEWIHGCTWPCEFVKNLSFWCS